MATGDVTISVAVEGGVAKSIVLDSATRVLSRTQVAGFNPTIDTDLKWQIHEVNKLGNVVLATANQQAESAASWTPQTFAPAT